MKDRKQLLRNPNYRWWLAADTLGMLKGVARALAVSLIAFALTHSEVLTALVGTVSTIASFAGQIPGGVVADVLSRKRLMRIGGLVGFGINGLLAVLVILGLLSYWILLVALATQAVFAGLFGSASDALLKSVVDTEDYPSAMAANQGRDSAIMLTADPLSGFLYSLGAFVPFAFSALAGLGQAFCSTKVQEAYQIQARTKVNFLEMVKEGFRFIWSRPVLRTLLLIQSLVTCGMVTITTAVQLYLIAGGISPVQIGMLGAVEGAAMLLGAALASLLVRRYATGQLLIVSIVWLAAVSVSLLFCTGFFPVLVAMGFASLSAPLFGATLEGYFYARIPRSLQARAYSVAEVVCLPFAAIAPLLAAGTLSTWGLGTAAGLGILVLVAAILLAVSSRSVRSIPQPSAWPIADQDSSEERE